MAQINEAVLDAVVRRNLPNLLSLARQAKGRGGLEGYLADSKDHIHVCKFGIVEDYQHAMGASRDAPP